MATLVLTEKDFGGKLDENELVRKLYDDDYVTIMLAKNLQSSLYLSCGLFEEIILLTANYAFVLKGRDGERVVYQINTLDGIHSLMGRLLTLRKEN